MFLDGVYECDTLEPPVKTDGTKPRAILAGTYDLIIAMSVRFKRLMPLLLNVPGFTGVEIHWGNIPADTEACTVVGETHAANFVGHSVAEFDLLFVKLQDAVNAGPCTVTYLDPA
jgi:hypothetical protein